MLEAQRHVHELEVSSWHGKHSQTWYHLLRIRYLRLLWRTVAFFAQASSMAGHERRSRRGVRTSAGPLFVCLACPSPPPLPEDAELLATHPAPRGFSTPAFPRRAQASPPAAASAGVGHPSQCTSDRATSHTTTATAQVGRPAQGAPGMIQTR